MEFKIGLSDKNLKRYVDKHAPNIYVLGILVRMMDTELSLDDVVNQIITAPDTTEEHYQDYRNATEYVKKHAKELGINKNRLK